MENTTVTVATRIDARLFRDFALFDTLRVKRRWKSPVLFALILLAASALCFAQQGRAEQAVLLGTVLLSVGLGLPVVYFVNFLASISAQIRKLGLDRPRPVYTLTLTDEPEGIRVSSPKGETAAYRWDSLYGVYRRRDCTYLYVHLARAFLLPDRDVGEQAEALQDLLQKYPAPTGRNRTKDDARNG